MKINSAPRVWEFDVDDTLILWDKSEYPTAPRITVPGKAGPVELVPHEKNANMLRMLSQIGWYIRVHSGSGPEWAEKIVRALRLEPYVDEICAKPLGRTDDRAPGDGLAYSSYRTPA